MNAQQNCSDHDVALDLQLCGPEAYHEARFAVCLASPFCKAVNEIFIMLGIMKLILIALSIKALYLIRKRMRFRRTDRARRGKLPEVSPYGLILYHAFVLEINTAFAISYCFGLGFTSAPGTISSSSGIVFIFIGLAAAVSSNVVMFDKTRNTKRVVDSMTAAKNHSGNIELTNQNMKLRRQLFTISLVHLVIAGIVLVVLLGPTPTIQWAGRLITLIYGSVLAMTLIPRLFYNIKLVMQVSKMQELGDGGAELKQQLKNKLRHGTRIALINLVTASILIYAGVDPYFETLESWLAILIFNDASAFFTLGTVIVRDIRKRHRGKRVSAGTD